MPRDFLSLFEEKDVSFNEFVWRCARGMAPFYHMQKQDNYLDSPLKMPSLNSSLKERKQKAEQEVKKYREMSLEEASKISLLEYNETLDKSKKQIISDKIMRQRVQSVLEQVKDWEPPTPIILP